MLDLLTDAPAFLIQSSSRPAPVRTLTSLLGPLAPAEFLRDYWDRWPFCLRRQQPDFYSALFSSRALDGLCAYPGLHPDAIPLLAQQVDGREVRRAAPVSDGVVDMYSLYESYAQGATIVLKQLQQRWLPLDELCHDMAACFQRGVRANAYLTPAGTKACGAHFDPDDVFALQVEGTKKWRIYAPAVEAPLGEQVVDVVESELGAPLHEIELQQGDLLYLPRGFIHEARASDRPSLHLTLRTETVTWVNLLALALTEFGKQQAEFRRALPAPLFEGLRDPEGTRAQFQQLLHAFADQADFEQAVELLADRFFGKLRALPSGHLKQLDRLEKIGPDTRLRKRPAAICRIRETDNEVEIQFPGNRVKGPSTIADALRFVACTDEFAVRGLPGLSENSQLVLTRRLVREGLLEQIDHDR